MYLIPTVCFQEYPFLFRIVDISSPDRVFFTTDIKTPMLTPRLKEDKSKKSCGLILIKWLTENQKSSRIIISGSFVVTT